MQSIRKIKVLENIPVLVRAALNVPVANGKVTNAFRLQQALPTIHFLQKRHARTILIGHIGDTGTETLLPVYEAMKALVPNLSFCESTVGAELQAAVRDIPPGGVLMLENLRRNAGEKKNDASFARELASLADVFVEDSFDVCHRKHASVVGIPAFLPSYAGITVETEVKELTRALKPRHKAIAIIGGAKFSTKEPVLTKLLATYDYVFVGGALANDFLKAKGYPVGKSLVSEEGQDHIKALLRDERLLIPIDLRVSNALDGYATSRMCVPEDVHADEYILDVGTETEKMLADIIVKSKTVLWNGPLGLFENGFMDGTRAVATAVSKGRAHSIMGGGDTIAAVEACGLQGSFSFISTGGGAMLDFLADGTLPGLRVLG